MNPNVFEINIKDTETSLAYYERKNHQKSNRHVPETWFQECYYG
jgi:hypothetical protein